MGRNKKWEGYTSWSYLEAGVDFDEYPLERQIDRVPRYDFGLSKDQEDRVEGIIEDNIIVDLHEHTHVWPEGYPHKNARHMQGRKFKGYEGLAHSGIDVVFDNCVCHSQDEALKFLGMDLCDLAHQDFIIPARRVEDIARAFDEGKIAVVHTLETSTAIGRDIDNIDLLYGLGFRSMGLVFSDSNLIGSGLAEMGDGGLTDLGHDAVKRMNKTGIIVDVSHAGDRTAMEAVEASDKPLLISHVGSRTLTDNARMLPDEVLRACAEKGGVVGVEVAGFAPRTERHPEASIECLLEHLEYLVDLLGVDHVGAGPDTFFGDHAGWYRMGKSRPARGHHPRPRPAHLPPNHDSAQLAQGLDHVKGLESPADFANIARGLVRDGFSDGEIAKVMGLNGLRVIKACWPK
jgi:membrane dipeptidase